MLSICPALFQVLLRAAEDIKVQRGYVICSAMHSPEAGKPELNCFIPKATDITTAPYCLLHKRDAIHPCLLLLGGRKRVERGLETSKEWARETHRKKKKREIEHERDLKRERRRK